MIIYNKISGLINMKVNPTSGPATNEEKNTLLSKGGFNLNSNLGQSNL
jgi:hypothetical protein